MKSEKQLIVPVLMAGGTGTRLWPLSRETYPKQFLALHGEKTLFQQTALRTADPTRFANPIVVVNNDHRFIAGGQLCEIGVSATIIVEPIGRNTAPAAAVAALHAQERDANALILLMPADHVIQAGAALTDALQAAVRAARNGRIVLFGIAPTSPATGYGYIRKGTPIDDKAWTVAEFVEKPDAARAQSYVASGDYAWNSGIFLAGARQLIAELERHEPKVVEAARAALAGGERDLDFLRLGADEFRRCPSISLDHAVMERTRRAAMLPLSCEWTDLGSWSTLWGISRKDGQDNVISGQAVTEDASGCYLRGEGTLVAAVGVEDLIVVATNDVVLVARKDRDQAVKVLVERLKREGREAAVSTRRVHRPWGFYESLECGHRFQVKRITVNPGAKLSLQKHLHRAEHWVVVNGTARVTRDGEHLLVRENESIYLPLGAVHRLENPGKLPLNVIEVQSGAYLGEDDIVRLEDIYQRV
jgi:mannose-1-phosphate guanylyltransferase/mannose-1-phosphate guanylyltransferase/mannose-6-phosphate isomerase